QEGEVRRHPDGEARRRGNSPGEHGDAHHQPDGDAADFERATHLGGPHAAKDTASLRRAGWARSTRRGITRCDDARSARTRLRRAQGGSTMLTMLMLMSAALPLAAATAAKPDDVEQLFTAIRGNRAAEVKSLLDANASLAAARNAKGRSALTAALFLLAVG